MYGYFRKPLIFIFTLLVLFVSCKKDSEESDSLNPSQGSLPVLSTNPAVDVTQNSAVSGGRITSDGGAAIFSKGVCWSTSPNPNINNSNTNDGSGTSDFTSNISGLFPGTTYYIRAYASNKNGNGYGQQVAITTSAVLAIGINYAGGIIFYLDSSGNHGFVCAQDDQSTAAGWGCSGTQTGANSSAVGTGQQNTNKILDSCAAYGIAAKICDSLTINGYDDWFLPSKEELKLMYYNLKVSGIGNFKSSAYWSSTEMTSTFAWEVIFNGGLVQGTGKNNQAYVRAVRTF